ncbi:MAG TPA: hypothetical protein DIC56_23830, partial [Rhizobium sp.]|nr:hypothetical protein [Rhizobium sp.]
MVQRELHAGDHVVLGRLQRDQDDVGAVEASEQVLVGRALDIDEDDFALLLVLESKLVVWVGTRAVPNRTLRPNGW